jgi:hypothetical protein
MKKESKFTKEIFNLVDKYTLINNDTKLSYEEKRKLQDDILVEMRRKIKLEKLLK